MLDIRKPRKWLLTHGRRTGVTPLVRVRYNWDGAVGHDGSPAKNELSPHMDKKAARSLTVPLTTMEVWDDPHGREVSG